MEPKHIQQKETPMKGRKQREATENKGKIKIEEEKGGQKQEPRKSEMTMMLMQSRCQPQIPNQTVNGLLRCDRFGLLYFYFSLQQQQQEEEEAINEWKKMRLEAFVF